MTGDFVINNIEGFVETEKSADEFMEKRYIP